MARCWMGLMLLCCWAGLLAQPPRHFRHSSDKDGLSDNRVQAILRDRQGYLWVGTANGLNRFDGYAFRQYWPDAADPSRSVCSASVHDLKQDRAGHIWIATNNGLNRYDPQTGKFRTWQNTGRDDGSLPNPIVWNLLLDGQDRLWLSCDNRDLCRYDAATDRFVRYPWRKFVQQVRPGTPDDFYSVIYNLRPRAPRQGEGESIWLGSNVGVYSFELATGAFAYHALPTSLPVASTGSDCPDLMHFGTWDQDILRWDGCSGSWAQVKLPLPAELLGGRRLVNEVFPYRGGHCVLARQGLFWMPAGSARVEAVVQEEPGSKEMPHGLLSDALLDADGSLWLGGEEGLWVAEAFPQAVGYHPLKPQVGDDFYNTFTQFLELPGREGQADTLLALDFYFAELVVQQTGRELARMRLPGRGGLLYQDRRGIIWVAGGPGIFHFDRKRMALVRVALPDAAALTTARGFFQAMAEDAHGRLWFAHSSQGVLVWNPGAGEWWTPDASDGFIGKAMTSVYADRKRQTVWLGSQDFGLFRYDEVQGTFRLYQPDSRQPGRSVGAYMVNAICGDSSGAVWIATDPGGLSRFDYSAPEDCAFVHLGMAEGLPSSRATGVACDARGRVWVGTLRGLACVDAQAGRIRSFTKADGLVTDFLDLPVSIGRSGRLYSGTVYGCQWMDPDSMLRERLLPGINLLSFRVFDREIGDSLALGGLERLDLSWRENFFSFEFASADVLAAGKTVYGYRLRGFDPDWMATGTRHQASYTNVPPGDYVLELRSGREGRWNAPGFELAIHISPPYWQRWWFRTLMAVLVVGAVLLVYRLRIRQVRKAEALKSEFNQRIARTEMAALRAQMNPHFVFNCLSSINRFILVNQPEEASVYLTKFSRLIRLILDNSRTETVVLGKEMEALKLYIELEQMRFADRFTYTITVDPSLQVEHLEVPPLLIQPYVENAIWHGLMHKKEACQLMIRLFPEGSRLCIEIEDNGVGREMAMALKSRSATTQKSLGMQVTSERLHVINRLYGIQATVETVDLFGADGRPAGTLIRLLL